MPLPVVSGAQAVRAFERAGVTFYTLSVPDHDELDPGTLRSLIRKAGLTVEDFTALIL